MQAFESVFLLRTISLEGQAKKLTLYLEDQLESRTLSSRRNESQFFEELIYRNVRAYFFYQSSLPFETFQFETRNGARIAFAFRTSKDIIGFLPVLDNRGNLNAPFFFKVRP